MRGKIAVAPLFAALLLSTALPAQDVPAALPAIPQAQDVPWPGGTIQLAIDASDTQRGIYLVTETIPLPASSDRGPRRLTLLLPQWLPGHHAPRGPAAELVGLTFTSEGKPVPWRRDPGEVHAFHLDLPEGAKAVEAKFLHTSPLERDEGRITMTQEMLNLQWEKMSLYPAGYYVRRIPIRPTVTLPAGWTAATALDGRSTSGNQVTWSVTDYETLVDSPIFAGRHFRQWDLGSAVTLDVVADEPELLAAKDEDIARLRALVREAAALFGRPPFDRYEFLVALTDRMGGIGLEHLRSSENQMEPRNFVDWPGHDWDRNVLPHELAHAWNGKYRRPARLWTPDYRTPMRDELLWVYEGQTQFWGMVLAARSGVQSKDMVLGMLASNAGKYAEQPGRRWRSVADTTLDPIISARKPKPYASLARDEDYYNEGALIWLEADQVIRAGTGGRRGLDDFARSFFAHPGDGSRIRTYDLGDVVAALNAVHPLDWNAFLRQRIEGVDQPAPLAGLEKAGYRLVWREEPNPYDKARMDNARSLSLMHSLGVTLDSDGDVTATQWDGPAFVAGIVSGTRIVAVNGLAYDGDRLKRAVARAKAGTAPIELLVKRGSRFATVQVPYRGGLRWPWLERVGGGAAALDRLLEPRGR